MSRLSGVVTVLLTGLTLVGCEFLGLESETGVSVIEHPHPSRVDDYDLNPESRVTISSDTVIIEGWRLGEDRDENFPEEWDSVEVRLTMIDRGQQLPAFVSYRDQRWGLLEVGEVKVAEWHLDSLVAGEVSGRFASSIGAMRGGYVFWSDFDDEVEGPEME